MNPYRYTSQITQKMIVILVTIIVIIITTDINNCTLQSIYQRIRGQTKRKLTTSRKLLRIQITIIHVKFLFLSTEHRYLELHFWQVKCRHQKIHVGLSIYMYIFRKILCSSASVPNFQCFV